MKRLTHIAALAALAAAFAAAQKIPEVSDLKYPPLKQVTIPEPAQFTLTNGLRIYLLENHELPLIRGFALVHTGNLFDPTDKHGLSQVMADVMRSGGTSAKTGDQLDEELEDVAASVESDMGETAGTVSFSALKESAGQVMSVFKDVLSDPEFRQDKIDLELNQMRGAIARRNDEASGIPRREMLRIVYGPDTPYGWEINYSDLDNIKRQDLIDFHKRYYFPANIMLAVYGDFKTDEMHMQLEQLFGSWTAGQPTVPPFPEVTAKPTPGIYFAPRTDVTQTFFSIGELGGTLRDPDYPALEVMANILGEGFSSRLISEIRTKLGYAYSIGATWDADYNHSGTFRIGGSTKSMSTVAALKATLQEVEKMRNSEVTAKELNDAKDAVLNSFVFYFDSPAKTLNRLMQYEYYGYPKDFLFDYQKAIASVTAADVLRVAKAHLHPEDLTIVAVGNPADFAQPLSDLGPVHELDLTIPEPKQATAAADAGSLAHGKELLQRAQQAMGGAGKLAAIRDAVQTVELKMAPSAGGITVKQVNSLVAPNHLRQEQELPGMKMVVYTDGVSGWLASPQGTQDMPPAILAQARGEVFRELTGLIMSDRDAMRTVNAVGQDAVEISGDGEVVALKFDPATGLPASETYKSAGANGAPSEVTETFSDWRDTGGVKMPYKISIMQGGQPMGEATVSEYKFNTGITAGDLSKRP